MNVLKRKCAVCDRKIKVRYISFGMSERILDSDEGTSFKNKWFCNECWEEIIKAVAVNLNIQIYIYPNIQSIKSVYVKHKLNRKV